MNPAAAQPPPGPMRAGAARADAPATPRAARAAVCFAASARDALASLSGARDAAVVLLGAEPSAAERAELASAGAAEVRFAPLAGGRPGASGLAAQEGLVEHLERLLVELDPRTLHAPSPLDADSDRAALGRALAAAASQGAPRTLRFAAPAEHGGGPAEPITFASDAWQVRRSAAELTPHFGGRSAPGSQSVPRATAVISTWNKQEDLRANLQALRAQLVPFAEIVVVDNASKDGTAATVARDFPEVRLIVMPHELYGACETFNIGFASVTTELTAILDDDVVLPPDWLQQSLRRLLAEPATTALVSTQVIEPGMPASYRDSPAVNQERYMSTFRGCASLARTQALRAAGFYDERLFIYGNERDLTCRLLNLGLRVLQFPGAHAFHKTPFGIKLGKRSLYYHARNAWLTMLKYAPLRDLARMPWLVLTRVVLRRDRVEHSGAVTDATGTIGIGRALRETPGAWLVLLKAAGSVLANVPYCLRHRRPCRASDFELPLS